MKKLFIAVLTLGIAASAHAGMIVPKLSLDGQGMEHSDWSGQPLDSNASAGVGIGVEYLNDAKEISNMKYGLGLEYQFPRASLDGGGYFGYMPMYLTGQYQICDKNGWKPYVKANLGYDLVYNADTKFKDGAAQSGGIYYAAGIGSNIYKDVLIAELMYSFYYGTWNGTPIEPSSTDIYSVVSLKIGYCFDLSK